MTINIEIQRLVNFETATDGTAVKLIVADIANREIGIVLKIETLTALLMTLPAMGSSAVKRAHNDRACGSHTRSGNSRSSLVPTTSAF
jgi:hypothetical protein